MKTYLLLILGLILLSPGNRVLAQYATCPNQGGDVTGHLDWRLRNASTGQIYVGAPQASTIYQLEIYETPYNNVAPNYYHYQTVGVQGSIDGFKLYTSVYAAQNFPNSYAPDTEISQGTGKDVGASSGVAVFGIKTLDANDPNWSGQITAFKAFGLCSPSTVTGDPNKYFKKTLVKLP